MNETVWNRLKQLSRVLPFKRKQEKQPDSDSGVIGVHYGCDACAKGINEGSNRYNCGECAASYDLCFSCYVNGEGAKHTELCGYLHELHLETRNELATCRLVNADTLEETVQNMFNFYAERPCIGVYVASRNRYEYFKYREVGQFVKNFGSGLYPTVSSEHTPGHGPFVALCSVVRLEWYIADFACCLLGLPTVGITASCDRTTISFILSQTESPVVVCSSDLYPVFLLLAEEKCLNIKLIVIMDLSQNETFDFSTVAKPVRSDLKVSLFSEMIENGAKDPLDFTQFKPDPEGIFTIAYTSGSTGNPKGCVFSRKLWLSHMNVPLMFLFGTKRVWFSFHPPSHMLERETFHLTLTTGQKACMYRGSMEHLFEDMRMVRPTVITSTPRLFAGIYNEYLQELYQEYQLYCKEYKEHNSVTDEEGTKQPESTTSSDTSSSPTIPEAPPIPKEFPKRLNNPSPCPSPPPMEEFDPFNVPYKIRDKVKQRFKNYFGGRERVIAVGGAAVPKELKTFLTFCFDAIVTEGYGTTEVGGICNGDWSMGDVTIRLRDVPEMGYLTTDNPPRGEVCVKTKNMISGYYKNKAETDEKFQDGFFCTGDIAVMDSPGHVIVIDRKKNIFKLAQGEFVAPERIEGVYESRSNLIEQIYLYGNIYRSNVVAVVVPHRPALLQWRENEQMTVDRNSGEEPDKTIQGDIPESTTATQDEDGIDKDEQEGQSPSDEDEPNKQLDQVMPELCCHPEVYELFMAELRTLGQSNELQGWEIPAAIILEPHPFTINNHLLTSTMKKSRPQLEKKYKQQLEQLYDKLESNKKKTLSSMTVEEEIFSNFVAELSARNVPVEKLSKFVVSNGPLDLTLSLTQMGGDSLSAMKLSNLIKEHFSLEIPAVTILKEPLLAILQSLTAALTGQVQYDHMAQTKDHSSTVIDWDLETDISFLKDASDSCQTATATQKWGDGRRLNVVLTGCTGFLGQFVLWELVNSEKVKKVYCLVRSLKDVTAEDRVNSILRILSQELSNSSDDILAQAMEKVMVLESDLSKPRLGLSDEDYDTIVTEVECVIHNGANVNHVLTYSDLKSTNVNSTKEVLKLCTVGQPKILHYVSTIGVFAALPWEDINEDSIPDKYKVQMLSGYSQSKWVCEQMIIKGVAEGLINSSSSISRPGLIGAHSETGHPNPNDWFFLLVQGLRHLKCYPTGASGWDRGTTDVLSVDIVAKSIVELSMRLEGKQGINEKASIYHLLNTAPEGSVSLSDIVNSINKNNTTSQLISVDHSRFLTLLSEVAKSHDANPNIISLHLLLSQGHCPLSTSRPHFDNRNSQMVLKGVNLDQVLYGYMERYIQYIHRNNY